MDRRKPVMGLSWSIKDGYLEMAFVSNVLGYHSVGFSPNPGKMLRADAVFAYVENGAVQYFGSYLVPDHRSE